MTSEILTLEKVRKNPKQKDLSICQYAIPQENYKLEQEYNLAQRKAETLEERNINLQIELEATKQQESDYSLGFCRLNIDF